MKTRSWGCEPDELERIWDALRFDHFKWDIFHRSEWSIFPDALVLTRDEHEHLARAAEDVWAALRQVEALVCASPEHAALTGVPAEVLPALRAVPPAGPRVTRCDFHRAPDGRWWISEYNDDVPSGFLECAGLAHVLADHFDGARFEGDLRRAVVDAFQPFERVGFVCATAYSEDLQHVACIEDWLAEAGHTVVRGSPQSFGRAGEQGTIDGAPVDAVYRYYPGEWIGELTNAQEWLSAQAAVPMTNPLRALASQSKRFYALPEALDLPLGAARRDLLRRFVPASFLLERMDRDRLVRERERWVLKGAFGRMGNTVHVGAFVDDARWRALVDEAWQDPSIVAVQERFASTPIWFSGGLGHATVGVYLVDGRFAGHFSRIDRHPLIAYDSWHVPTLVEVAPEPSGLARSTPLR